MRFLCNWNCSEEEAVSMLLQDRDHIVIDIETVDLENTLPIGIGVAIDPTHGCYFFDVRDELLGEALRRASTIIAHNAKFDIPKLQELGHKVNGFEDSMTLAYSGGNLDRSLAYLSETILLRDCPSVTSLWRNDKTGNIGIDHIELGKICMTHATNTYALWEELPKVQLYNDLDKPYLQQIMEMESWGLLIDQRRLTEVDHETTVKMLQLQEELYRNLGKINLASNPQVASALQSKGILGTRKTKKGADSVSDESLAPLHNPIADLVLEHRKLMKTLTTYVPAFRAVDHWGRLHTDFGYARTGRLTSSKPNLQNISNNGLRDCIISPRDFQLISLDASQLELRVVAILSQDPLLLEALESTDLHLATAIKVFGYTDDIEEMTKRRYAAKQINFAVLYGATSVKIAEMIGCSIPEAEVLIDQYFSTYKVLSTWISTSRSKAEELGYVTNLFGRIRPLPDLLSGSWQIREKGQKEVVNTIVQGTAADIVKMMQLYLRGEVDREVRFILQVHDEVLMEVPDRLVDSTLRICRELPLAFPQYPVTIKVGSIYGRLEKISN